MNAYDQDGLFALLILFDFMLAWQISHRFDIILSSCGAHSVFLKYALKIGGLCLSTLSSIR